MKRPAAQAPALSKASAFLLATACTLAVAPQTFGQNAPKASTEPKATAPAATAKETPVASNETSDEVVQLDPFVVSAEEDQGYSATATLGGTRVRTDLRDLATSISVVTAEFLRDTGAKNNQTLLQYTTNTEVGGVYGNFSGTGNTFVNGAGDNVNTLLRPNSNTRVRGLDSADNTRDYWIADIPWDGYNVDRVELQRGPNSILFGVGSPAGIVNISTIQAGYKTKGKVESRVGSFQSLRNVLDYNQVLVDGVASLRVAAVDDKTKYRQKPAHNNDRRLFLTGRVDPKLFGEGNPTSIKASVEFGKVNANRPRTTPPFDKITPFFYTQPLSGSSSERVLNRRVFDPYDAWRLGYAVDSTGAAGWAANNSKWIAPYLAPGLQITANPVFVFDANGVNTTMTAFEATPQSPFAISSSGDIDSQIGGYPFARQVGIAGFYEYARAQGLNGADRGYWKDKALTDETIFDFYNNLIDGPNKKEWQNWTHATANATQSLFNNRLNFQIAYQHQNYRDGYSRNLGWSPYISVDINTNMMDYPATLYPGMGVANPNVGRPLVGSNAQNQGGSSFIRRNDVRGIVNFELHAKDLTDNELMQKIFNKQLFTGVVTEESAKQENRNWAPYGMDLTWNAKVDPNKSKISEGSRIPDLITYIGPDLRSKTTASGLYLSPINAVQNPTGGTINVRYFDSHYKTTAPSPGNAWTTPVDNTASTQSENPANYEGWKTGSFRLYNAAGGDIDNLYADVSRVERDMKSKGAVWQGYWWDGTLVTTAGWREDEQTLSAFQGKDLANGSVSTTDFDSIPSATRKNDSTTWGLVLHTPKEWKKNLPWGMDISLHYGRGQNSRVENRYSFDGSALPDGKGKSKEYGFAVSALDEKVQFKATWYNTKYLNANLGAGEAGTLGSNTYYLYLLEAWGTASAVEVLAGQDNRAPGWEWYWNWALVDHGWDGAYNDPTTALFKNDASTIAAKNAANNWISTLKPQSFFDAYGFAVDTAKLKSGNLTTMISGLDNGKWGVYSGIGGIQAAGKGRIKGVYPTGTIDTESKGVELELNAKPTKNLNLAINASKTFASRGDLGADLVALIESTKTRFDGAAGDLRLWWAGDTGAGTIRGRYLANIWAPYLFQKDSKGTMVPEMSPWRVNTIANYNFSEGALKGVNIGGGYRWQQGTILGYGLTSYQDSTGTQYKLDVNKPFWGKADDHVDIWMGYGQKITTKIDWRIQLNLRNVAESRHLRLTSVQPDGTPANYQIQEGMTWELTNTFSF